MNIQDIKEIDVIKVDRDNITIQYLDMINSGNTPSETKTLSREFGDIDSLVEMKVQEKNILLGKINPDSDIKHIVADFIDTNFLKPNIFKEDKTYMFDIYTYDLDVEQINDKIFMRVINASNYIAMSGRFGKANKLIVNQTTYDNYLNDNLDQYSFNQLEIVINDYLPNNKIYLNRTDSRNDNPGFKMYYKDDTTLAICGIGFNPNSQTAVIEIFE